MALEVGKSVCVVGIFTQLLTVNNQILGDDLQATLQHFIRILDSLKSDKSQ